MNQDLTHFEPRKNFIQWLPFLCATALAVYFYSGINYITAYGPSSTVFLALKALWSYEEWQHCWLVPAACILIVWLQRKELAELPLAPSWLGVPAAMLAFAFFWLSYRLDDIYFAFLSMQAMVAALILMFLGTAWMKALLFPWLFLVFAWPLFFLDTLIAFPLRMIMSTASVHFLNILGIAAEQNGTAILSAADALTGRPAGKMFSVDVADPCSGIRSLFALMMVSSLYGYFTFKSWWKRLLIFLFSAPLAIIGNLFRILALTFGTIALGPEIAIGTLEHPTFFHMLAGYVVFVVALGGMVLVGFLINFDWHRIAGSLRQISQNKAHPTDCGDDPPDAGTNSRDIY